MADDPKSIGKSLAEISSLLKDGVKASEGNQAAEKEARNEEKRERTKLFGGLKASMEKMGEGLKSLVKPASGGGFFAKLLGGLGTIAMGVIGPILGFFGTAGPIAKMAAKILPFLGPAGHIAKLGLKFLGPLILLIDGFIGFFKGWANSEESNIALKIVDGLQGAFSQILSSLTLGFVSFDVIQEFTQPFFDYIKDWVKGVFAIWDDDTIGFGEKIWLTVKEVFRAFVDYLVLSWDLTVAGIKLAWEGLKYALSPEGLMAAGTAIADAFMYVSDWVFGVFEKPITYMAMIMDRIMTSLKVMFFKVIGYIDSLAKYIPFFDGIMGVEAAEAAAASAIREGLASEAAYRTRLSQIDEENAEAERQEELIRQDRIRRSDEKQELLRLQAERDRKEAEMRAAGLEGPVRGPVASVAVQNNNTSVQTSPLMTRPPQSGAIPGV